MGGGWDRNRLETRVSGRDSEHANFSIPWGCVQDMWPASDAYSRLWPISASGLCFSWWKEGAGVVEGICSAQDDKGKLWVPFCWFTTSFGPWHM